MSVKDKVAVVTGGTKGIGLAIAQQLAQEGAKVVVCSRNQSDCDAVAAELAASYGVETLGLQLDVASFEAVQDGIKTVLEKFSAIHILVNNAGITKDNLLLRMSKEDWDSVVDINLSSVFNTTKAVLRPMLKQRAGRIINISSVVGQMGNPGQGNYAAAKAGMIGFTKSIAKEVGAKGITCNAVAPGFIRTQMTDKLPEEYLESIVKSIPLRRLGQPEDIAQAVTYLASDKACYMTGQVLTLDGGIYL